MVLILVLAVAASADVPPRSCPPSVDVPRDWPRPSARLEAEVLGVINRHRGQGVQCRATGTRRPPVRPLKSSDALRRAARGHSTYMAEHRAFDHTVAGCEFSTWINDAGYRWHSIGENIALRRGTRAMTAEEVVEQWLASREGHCEALMDPKWRSAGVGYAHEGNRHLYTIDFGDR